MVTFNINDAHMEKLTSQSELRLTKISKPFYVYGMCKSGGPQPKVIVYAKRSSVPKDASQMIGFLHSKGIELEIKNRARKEITIGTDIRLRDNASMFHRVVDTLVYWMDGKLTGLPETTQPTEQNV